MGKLDELRRTATGNFDESMGRGQGAIPGVSAPGPRPVSSRLQGVARSANAASIPLDRIVPDPDQPREAFEPAVLERLAASLRETGQLQPIRVRWDEDGDRYVIICGERRWRAAGLAGHTTMQCVIVEGPVEPGELLTLRLIEDCVRGDLRPSEQARDFRALMDRNAWWGADWPANSGSPSLRSSAPWRCSTCPSRSRVASRPGSSRPRRPARSASWMTPPSRPRSPPWASPGDSAAPRS